MPVDFEGETLAEQIQNGFLQAAEKIKESLKGYFENNESPEETSLYELYQAVQKSVISSSLIQETTKKSLCDLEKTIKTLSDAIENNTFLSLPLETHPSFGGHDRYIVNLRSSTSSPPDSSSSTP